MANRVVLNCRKVSRNVTYTVTGSTTGGTRIVAHHNDDGEDDGDDHDDGVTKEVSGRKEVLSVSEEDSGEGLSGLGIPTLDCQWP